MDELIDIENSNTPYRYQEVFMNIYVNRIDFANFYHAALKDIWYLTSVTVLPRISCVVSSTFSNPTDL